MQNSGRNKMGLHGCQNYQRHRSKSQYATVKATATETLTIIKKKKKNTTTVQFPGRLSTGNISHLAIACDFDILSDGCIEEFRAKIATPSICKTKRVSDLQDASKLFATKSTSKRNRNAI